LTCIHPESWKLHHRKISFALSYIYEPNDLIRMQYFSFWDLVVGPVYLAIIFMICYFIKIRWEHKNYAYRFLVPGLIVKIGGGIALCFIYSFYYTGGDTIGYYVSSVALSNVFLENPQGYFSLLFEGNTTQNWRNFNANTGWPYWYFYRDVKTFIVCKIYSPLTFFSFNSFIGVTLISSALSYIGIWKMFLVFCEEYPNLTKPFAFAFLFVPSVVFWGSGLLKDTITFTCLCWFISGLYHLFFKRRKMVFNVIVVVISVAVIVSIRPYIFIAALPAVLTWILYGRIRKVKNTFIRALIVPLFLVVGIAIFAFLLLRMDSVLGKYSTENVLETAVVTQKDLKREAYQGHSFDIGDFEPSYTGILKVAPSAILAGLFRPFIWEAGNIVMLLSAVENMLLMLFLLYLIIKTRLVKLFLIIKNDATLTFCLVFSLFFAFSIGLATSNFGSLVRYKIPLIPLFLSALFIIWGNIFEKKNEWEMEEEELNA